jgi:regulatory protein
MQRAIAALARREYSRAELTHKLRLHTGDEHSAELKRVLDELQAKGLLSDARFAAMLARSRGQRFGAARIRQELREHGLDDDLVRAVMEPLAQTEEQRARAVWRKRFGRAPVNAAERARQLRFLSQRGFATDVILRVVGGGGEADD